jgi:hypothetical protein
MSSSADNKCADGATAMEMQNVQWAWSSDASIPSDENLPPPYVFDCPPYAPQHAQPAAPFVIIHQPIPVKQSYASHVAMACLVFWLCGAAFGLAALLLASNFSPLQNFSLPSAAVGDNLDGSCCK